MEPIPIEILFNSLHVIDGYYYIMYYIDMTVRIKTHQYRTYT